MQSIDFSANTKPLEDAKKKLVDLKETIESLRTDPGGSSSMTSEALRTISEDITRMKSLVSQGENKGGILNMNQWKELDRVTGRINKNFDDWNKNLLRVGGELHKAKSLVANMEKDGRLLKQEFEEPQFHRRYKRAVEERDQLEKEYTKLKKSDPAKERLADKAQDLAARAGTLEQEQEQSRGGSSLGLGKLLGVGTMLAGGFSILSYLSQARNEYRKYQMDLGGLAARGINGVNPSLGFGAAESVAIMRGITHGTGYSGKAASGFYGDVTRFARANDVDPGQAASLLGGYRDILGSKEQSRRQLYLLTHIAENTKETPERINRTLSAGFSVLSHAQGGKELSAAQQGEMSAFAEKMATRLGTMGKNPSTMQAFGGAFKGTGNKMVDLAISEMVGMIGGGPITFDTIMKANQLRSTGLTTREGRELFRKYFNQGTGSHLPKSGQAVFLSEMLKGHLSGKENLEELLSKLKSGELESDTSYAKYAAGGKNKAISGSTSRKAGAYQSTVGYRVARQEYERESNRLKTGAGIYKLMAPLEDEILKRSGELLDSKAIKRMIDAAAGVTKNVQLTPEQMAEKMVNPKTGYAEGTTLFMLMGIKLVLTQILHALEKAAMYGSET